VNRTDVPPVVTDLFKSLRSPAGDDMILKGNFFAERVLQASVLSPLAADVLDE
jgi:hypothetical protein